MSTKTRYVAIATREGKWWLIDVPQIDQVTQARRVDQIELMAREMVGVTRGLPLDDVEVDVVIDSIGDVSGVTDTVTQIAAERQHAVELERHALVQAADLAHKLSAVGVPVRDIGAILGVSFQRVSQILAAK